MRKPLVNHILKILWLTDTAIFSADFGIQNLINR